MQKEHIQMPIGSDILVTTDNWFYGADGKQYRAVTGKLIAILTDDVLGIRTNARSTNWYIQVGSMMIAGCQVHYAQRLDKPLDVTTSVEDFDIVEGETKKYRRPSRIYNAGDNK